jgi:eukaryotic-like serine/threonine-protein kinase
LATIFDRLKDKLGERYELERELGQGGMATVFLARDLRHDREVAIKVLHPELSASIGAERFEREIKLAAKLQHPNILGLYDSGAADGLLYYVMPFIKGESLRDRLDREGQLPIDDAVQIVLEVAEALGHAHAAGIIHRDIKPENILLSGGHALVADFGIARAASEAGAQKLTQTGMAVGTPVYMSPEQAVGDHVGPTSDLYSLGCVLYELLAGEPPFLAKSAQALMARHSMEAVPSVRIVRNTVPEEVEDAIFAAMAKVPADRPQTAAQFMEMLGLPMGATASRRATIRHTASRRVPTGMLRVAEPEPEPAPWWRRPWVLGLLALLVGGGGFAAWKAFAASQSASMSPDELARARKVAVLYFGYPEPDLAPVADGLTEALIASLRAANLDVVSRNGVLPFRGTKTPVDSIADRLEVGTLVRGSIAPEGDQIRITTWLTDADGNDQGEHDNFLIHRDSLGAAEAKVVEEASRKLRQQLRVTLVAEARSRAGNQAAWRLLQRGEKARNDADQAALSDPKSALPHLAEADSLLEQAALADPAWVDPVLARGEVALQRAQFSPAGEKLQWIDAGFQSAGRAMKLDATNARTLALRGSLEYEKWRALPPAQAPERAQLLRSAEADLQAAVRDDPLLASAYATLSRVMYEKKDVYSALDRARSAYNADRYLANSAAILDRLFYSSYDTGNFAEAESWCDEGERRFPRNPTFTRCHLWLMIAPDAARDVPEAWRLAVKLDSLYQSRSDSARQYQASFSRILVGGAIGKKVAEQPSPLIDSARRVLARARPDVRVDPKHELAGYEGVMRAQIGDLDEAIGLFKEYVSFNPDHSFRVGQNIHWWYRELRGKPEFQALVDRRR